MILPDHSVTDSVSIHQSPWLIRALWLLVFAGLCLGLYSVWYSYFIFTDGAIYATLGKNLAEGKGLRYCGSVHLFYPPGYPLAIAVLYAVTRDAELSAHLVSLFAYLGTILLTIRLAWSMRSSLLFVLLSTCVVVFHPYLILFANHALSESLFACVVLASAYCAWILSMKSKSPLWLWCLWGLLGGYLYLIRADGVLYWPLQAGFILYSRRGKLHAEWFPGAMAVLAFVLVMAPYLYLIKQETGKWQLSTKTAILLEFSRMKMLDGTPRGETRQTSQLSPDGKSFAIDQSQDTLGSFLLHQPREAIQRIRWNGSRLWKRNDLVFSWLTIPALALLGVILKRRILSGKSLFLSLHGLPIIIFLIFYVEDRFLLAFIPFFAFPYARIAEWGLVRIWNYAGKRILFVGVPVGLTVFALLVFLAAPGIQRVFHRIVPSDLPIEHKQMGEWMRENCAITPTTRITHRNPWVSFYAGGCHARTPDFDLKQPEEERVKQLINWCRERGVEYVIVDERMTLPSMPGLAYLLDETKPHEGLHWEKTIQEEPYPKIVLYAVQPSENSVN